MKLNDFWKPLVVLSVAAGSPGALAADPQVDLKTNLGTIRIELYPAKAPKSVENFLQYVKDGHFNGTIFHRVIDNFMIQGGGFAKTNRQFFRFLREEAARADSLYVLGDLFEYWAGDDELKDPAGDPLAAEVAAGFKALSDKGVQVRLMHGNRDFLVGEGFLAASGAQLLEDPTVLKLKGGPVALLHGDTLCTDDHDYQAWRQTARSEAWQREFLGKPLAARHEAVGALREKSKDVIAATPAEIMDVNADPVRDAFRRLKVRRMIHG